MSKALQLAIAEIFRQSKFKERGTLNIIIPVVARVLLL
jgi:hypothetical protein